MRLVAVHNGKTVIIVQFLYEGSDNENLKAVYVNEDGELSADAVANFLVAKHERTVING